MPLYEAPSRFAVTAIHRPSGDHAGQPFIAALGNVELVAGSNRASASFRIFLMLKPALRPEINTSHLHKLVYNTLVQKPAEHLFRLNYQPQRVMTAIGG